VDSAVAYRNEEPSAKGLKKAKLPRSELYFTTKVPPGQNDYQKAKDHIDNTLKITGLEYVDLYLLHAPFGGKEGRLGAWKALVEGVEAGKIRSIGVSNYGVRHLQELEDYIKGADGKGGVLSVNQVELHPWLPRRDIVEWCEKRGVVLEVSLPSRITTSHNRTNKETRHTVPLSAPPSQRIHSSCPSLKRTARPRHRSC
jgi:diketogulonate reductase-like aldo/keto reductase